MYRVAISKLWRSEPAEAGVWAAIVVVAPLGNQFADVAERAERSLVEALVTKTSRAPANSSGYRARGARSATSRRQPSDWSETLRVATAA